MVAVGLKGFSEKDQARVSRFWEEFKREYQENGSPSAKAAQQRALQQMSPENVQKKPKLRDLVQKHLGLLEQSSSKSINQFLKEIGMCHLEGTLLSLELEELKEGYWIGPVRVSPPFKNSIRSSVADSLAGKIREADKKLRQELPKGDFNQKLRHFELLPAEEGRKFFAAVVTKDLQRKHFSKTLFSLFDGNFDYLKKQDPGSFGSSVIGYVTYLVGSLASNRSCELIDILMSSDLKGFRPVLEFLRFLLTPRPNLRGSTSFDELSPQDLFLAACYYNGRGQVGEALEQIHDWSLESLRGQLTIHDLRKFLVRGVQPRVAEMAFEQILREFNPEGSALDLNLQKIKNDVLEHPGKKRLPPADWQTAGGDLVDVKCNLFFRSKAPSLGLRGLLINRPDRENVEWVGFVFHASSDDNCSWSYLGTMSRRCLGEEQGGGAKI
ncbi:hypothetical protein N9195_01550 [bacterium]|nr:hypothetical protein [bacterium]